MSEVIKLSAPIKAHDEELTELTLRRPALHEVKAIKSLPYHFSNTGEVIMDADIAVRYIPVCAGIPASSVEQIDLFDLNNITWQIVSFFITPASATLKA
ncbi:phage tail assembly protein [Pseudomonas putida]|uniref:phage tail assembly protein n=1 Tax=Pseudomonas putida TaxID=303 RepID=UPI002022EC56|nr:phage tail assembly protein [Pseudomonas putida]MCL8308783.1 phage tail assembly protein [Pseudomonas putida]